MPYVVVLLIAWKQTLMWKNSAIIAVEDIIHSGYTCSFKFGPAITNTHSDLCSDAG